MILEKGNMWSIWNKTDHFIFTGNSFIKRNGALVMGRGIAKEVRDRFPGIDKKIGSEISREYGVILGSKVGIFQVKYHFKDHADLNLISQSAADLKIYAEDLSGDRFDMNFPGIGYGGLHRKTVLPYLQDLPDNIHIWEFK